MKKKFTGLLIAIVAILAMTMTVQACDDASCVEHGYAQNGYELWRAVKHAAYELDDGGFRAIVDAGVLDAISLNDAVTGIYRVVLAPTSLSSFALETPELNDLVGIASFMGCCLNENIFINRDVVHHVGFRFDPPLHVRVCLEIDTRTQLWCLTCGHHDRWVSRWSPGCNDMNQHCPAI